MSPEEKMQNDLEKLQRTANEIMFVLRGSHEAHTTGIVQDLQNLKSSVETMIDEIAHLFRFKKRIEQSQIDQEKRDRERIAKELEIQKLKRDSQLKTWGIMVSLGSVIIKMVFDYFTK